MTLVLSLQPYFELAADGEAYQTGLRSEGNDAGGLNVLLSADVVETLVVKKARLLILFSPGGMLSVTADGLSEEVLHQLHAAASLPAITISEAVRRALDPELLAPDEDAVYEVANLCRELEACLKLAQNAAARLQT